MRMQKDSIRIAILKTSGRLTRISCELSTAAAHPGMSIQIPDSGINPVHILFLTSVNPVA
jgi:hypothetical protein